MNSRSQSPGPLAGFGYFLRGLRWVLRPGIRPLVIMPFLINLLLFAGGMILLILQFGKLTDWLAAKLPEGLGWLTWFVWPLLMVLTLLVFAYCFSMVANWIASPFNGLLAERVEQQLTGTVRSDESSWKALLREIPSALKREWRKFVYYAPRALLCLMFFLVPLVGSLLGPFVFFLFNAWMLSMAYADYSFDNHKVPFDAMQQRLKEKRSLCVGFGVAAAGATILPLMNLVVMPVAVCGATVMTVEQFGIGRDGSPVNPEA